MVRFLKRLGRSLLHLLVGLVILAGSAIGLLIFFVGSVLVLFWRGCLLFYAIALYVLPVPVGEEDVRH